MIVGHKFSPKKDTGFAVPSKESYVYFSNSLVNLALIRLHSLILPTGRTWSLSTTQNNTRFTGREAYYQIPQSASRSWRFYF